MPNTDFVQNFQKTFHDSFKLPLASEASSKVCQSRQFTLKCLQRLWNCSKEYWHIFSKLCKLNCAPPACRRAKHSEYEDPNLVLQLVSKCQTCCNYRNILTQEEYLLTLSTERARYSDVGHKKNFATASTEILGNVRTNASSHNIFLVKSKFICGREYKHKSKLYELTWCSLVFFYVNSQCFDIHFMQKYDRLRMECQ